MSFRQVAGISTDEAAPSRLRGSASPNSLAIGPPIASISSIPPIIRSTAAALFQLPGKVYGRFWCKICKSTVYILSTASLFGIISNLQMTDRKIEESGTGIEESGADKLRLSC